MREQASDEASWKSEIVAAADSEAKIEEHMSVFLVSELPFDTSFCSIHHGAGETIFIFALVPRGANWKMRLLPPARKL
jgi:hypothetical protein